MTKKKKKQIEKRQWHKWEKLPITPVLPAPPWAKGVWVLEQHVIHANCHFLGSLSFEGCDLALGQDSVNFVVTERPTSRLDLD